MKRMLISPAQLKVINEAAIYGGEFGSDTSLIDAAKQYKANNPNNPTNSPVTFTNTAVANNTSTGLNNVAYDPGNPEGQKEASKVTMSAADLNNLSESRFSKRQVELGRMLEMRRTGKVYSKKQLNEMFMETQENVTRLKDIIGDCRLFDVFQAANILAPDGEERLKEAFSNGADLKTTLMGLFSAADTNKQEEFLEELDG